MFAEGCYSLSGLCRCPRPASVWRTGAATCGVQHISVSSSCYLLSRVQFTDWAAREASLYRVYTKRLPPKVSHTGPHRRRLRRPTRDPSRQPFGSQMGSPLKKRATLWTWPRSRLELTAAFLSLRSASSVRITPGCCHPSWTGQTWPSRSGCVPLNMLCNVPQAQIQRFPAASACDSVWEQIMSIPSHVLQSHSAVTTFPACRLPGSVARTQEHVVLNVIQTSIEGKQWRGGIGGETVRGEIQPIFLPNAAKWQNETGGSLADVPLLSLVCVCVTFRNIQWWAGNTRRELEEALMRRNGSWVHPHSWMLLL